jgi:hypothetical protein
LYERCQRLAGVHGRVNLFQTRGKVQSVKAK